MSDDARTAYYTIRSLLRWTNRAFAAENGQAASDLLVYGYSERRITLADIEAKRLEMPWYAPRARRPTQPRPDRWPG